MPGYDPGARRRGVRRGRERGCWVYVPAEELEKLALAPDDGAPWYRLYGRTRGRTVVVQFYREP